MSCFNNCDSANNGEDRFFYTHQHEFKVIFDVGSRFDSTFQRSTGEVHYFEPVEQFLNQLKAKPSANSKAVYNPFGLSDTNATLYYYPRYQSFLDRTTSCHVSDDANKIQLNVRRADEYVRENGPAVIDFLKIDTEGYELHVIRGFGEELKRVRVIQFEYGGTYLDNGIKLIEVIEYLRSQGFDEFAYLSPTGEVPLTDFKDHYQYCNIVCYNQLRK